MCPAQYVPASTYPQAGSAEEYYRRVRIGGRNEVVPRYLIGKAIGAIGLGG